MPVTIAHACAVLPFNRFCPRYLNLPALICGSMAPDLAYILHLYKFSAQAHTAFGSFALDIPTGLLLLLLYYLAKDTIASQLPAPHNQFWRAQSNGVFDRSRKTPPLSMLKTALAVCISLFIGTWTHIIWDGFTHEHGFAVDQISMLNSNIQLLPGMALQVYKLLQYGCSVIGLVILCVFYKRQVQHMPVSDNDASTISAARFNGLLIAASLSTLILTLFQNYCEHTFTFAHSGFVFMINCMFMFPVVFYAGGLLSKSQTDANYYLELEQSSQLIPKHKTFSLESFAKIILWSMLGLFFVFLVSGFFDPSMVEPRQKSLQAITDQIRTLSAPENTRNMR